jgi:hypothetical protein
MARWRVDSRFWDDPKVKGLTDGHKLLFLYLMTHPAMTSVGAMRETIPGIAAEMRWTEKEVGAGVDVLRGLGLVDFDPSAPLIVLPQFHTWNPPESPNVVRSWGSVIETVPQSDILAVHLAAVGKVIAGMGSHFKSALPKHYFPEEI